MQETEKVIMIEPSEEEVTESASKWKSAQVNFALRLSSISW